MNNKFIENSMWKGRYVLSPYTNASYYASNLERDFEVTDKTERERAIKNDVKVLVQSGEEWLLPHRLGILRGSSMASFSHSGRARKKMEAQLKGRFTQIEHSPYKQYKPFEVQSGLWQVEDSQIYYYGSVGISGPTGRVETDNADLLIVRTPDWKTIDICVFKGLAGVHKQLDHLQDVLAFLKGL